MTITLNTTPISITLTTDEVNLTLGGLDLTTGSEIEVVIGAIGKVMVDSGVTSVNTKTGVVVLTTDDIDDSADTNKYTTAGDISKLAGIEAGATADQSDAEIETAYNNQVSIVSQAEAEAGIATTVRRWTAERVKQAIDALAAGGGVWGTITGTLSSQTDLQNALNAKEDNLSGASLTQVTGADGDLVLVQDVSDSNNLKTVPKSEFGASTLPASSVIMDTLGTPTYTTVQDMIATQGSGGVISGGAITDGGSGTVDITAGEIYIRSASSDISGIYSADFPSVTGFALTDNSLNFIYVEYNAGTPQIVAYTTAQTDVYTNIIIGVVHRAGTTLHITNFKTKTQEISQTLGKRLAFVDGLTRQSGSVTSETGTRNIAITAGDWWLGLIEYNLNAVDTSAADSFIYYYQDGVGGFTAVTGQTQIDNTQYDDGSGTLATLGVAKYGVHWVYQGLDNDTYVVYGRGNYNLSQAENAAPPANLPPHMNEFHVAIVAKIIIQNGAAAFTSVENPFAETFGTSTATSHGDLSDLGADYHTQYHNDARALTWLGTRTSDDLPEGAIHLYFTSAEQTKLSGIESGATADQSDAEIKTAYENNANTNAFTDAEQTKLTGIETNATADQRDAEIETAYSNIVGQVSAGEKTAGTETALRTYSPLDIADMAGTHGGGGGLTDVVDDLTPQAGGNFDMNSKVFQLSEGSTLGTSDVSTNTLTLPDDGNVYQITQVIGFDKIANDLPDGTLIYLYCDSGGAGTTLEGGLRLEVKTGTSFGLDDITMERGDVATFVRRGESLGATRYSLQNYHRSTLLPVGISSVASSSIASASVLPVTGENDYFDVTGTTSINLFQNIGVGRRVVLVFASALTINYNALFFVNFPNDAAISVGAGDVMEFVQISFAGGLPKWGLISHRNKDGALSSYAPKQDYTITNDTTDRTFDANSTSTAELADVLATLLKDLEDAGIVTTS